MSMQNMNMSEFKQEHWDSFVELFDEWYNRVPPEWKEKRDSKAFPTI